MDTANSVLDTVEIGYRGRMSHLYQKSAL